MLYAITTLAMTVAADPASPAPTQPTCPWHERAFSTYYPDRNAIVAPEASMWIVAAESLSLGMPDPSLFKGNGQVPVEVDIFTTELPFGRLIQVKPKMPLGDGDRFELFTGETKDTVIFSAGGPALTAPNKPIVRRVSSNLGLPYGESCQTYGIVIQLEPDDSHLYFAYDEGGALVGVSKDSPLVVEAQIAGREICVTVVGVDASGRQSEPSDPQCAYGAEELGYVDAGAGSGFGCSATQGVQSSAWFALVLAVGLFLRTVTIYRK